MFEPLQGERPERRQRLRLCRAIADGTSSLSISFPSFSYEAPVLLHRFRFPKLPWPFVSSILAAVHHLLRFLGIEVRDVPSKRDRLNLYPCVEVEVNAASNSHRNCGTHNSHTMTAHQHGRLIAEHLGER